MNLVNASFAMKMQKSEEDSLKILRFLAKEKHVAFNVLMLLFDFKSPKSLRLKLDKLLKLGYIRKEDVYISYSLQQRGGKSVFYILTTAGATFLETQSTECRYRYDRNHGLVYSQLNHTNHVQVIRALYLKRGDYADYPNAIGKSKVMDLYIPDHKIAVEVELTFKSKKRYLEVVNDYFTQRLARQIAVDEVHYVVPDQRFLERLETVFSGINEIMIQGRRVLLSAENKSIFHFYLFDDYLTRLKTRSIDG